ncbi:MAG: YaiI/YqxD family protein [Pseudomonadota bacterium]
MQIWVDADACPRPIKEVLFRAANRTATPTTLVANQYLRTPPSRWIKALQVPAGFDVADHEIVERVEPDDLVITADVPLADAVIARGAVALNPRGRLYTAENIKADLARRDRNETMRAAGLLEGGGPPAFSPQDVQQFANALDRWLARNRPAPDR